MDYFKSFAQADGSELIWPYQDMTVAESLAVFNSKPYAEKVAECITVRPAPPPGNSGWRVRSTDNGGGDNGGTDNPGTDDPANDQSNLDNVGYYQQP
ncbi:hypothetical protein [Spirosoma sp. 48-14]|uniref:hypothetical protein n=1 Tax=Spirosoma sp. 48-14 TaxID=1895854 RepID=UPI00095F3EC8|nr:hypothetical protein [Spirosoma sp. 48-14]OJW78458.1 MAG: hypothetical protein BGO59_31130 [Spirosoma sp. 48-14]